MQQAILNCKLRFNFLRYTKYLTIQDEFFPFNWKVHTLQLDTVYKKPNLKQQQNNNDDDHSHNNNTTTNKNNILLNEFWVTVKLIVTQNWFKLL